MTIGIIPNLTKDPELSATKNVIKWLQNRSIPVQVEEKVASSLSMPQIGCKEEALFSDSEMLITLGGDGTLLGSARRAAPYQVPILGINLGHLGFLTEAEESDMYSALERYFAGDYDIEKRIMLEAFLEKESMKDNKLIALNDIEIARGTFSRMIRFSIFINDNFANEYSADGLIISSPTGSTAYSLSAGGPIVCPDLDVIIITPVCPHTLHSRSIVVSSQDEIKVYIHKENTEFILTFDGQDWQKLPPGETVRIRQSKYYTNLIKLRQRSFFDVLRLKISERYICKSESV